MKRALAVLVTLLLLGWVLYVRRPSSQTAMPRAETPEQCVDNLFLAAERGDVAAYLECFDGVARQRLEHERAAEQPEAFARSLTQAIEDLKGRAVTVIAGGEADSRHAEIVVERIYAQHNDRQLYGLDRLPSGWRITATRTLETFQPSRMGHRSAERTEIGEGITG